MEQRCRAPFAGISRIRFQGTVSIRGGGANESAITELPDTPGGHRNRKLGHRQVNGTADALQMPGRPGNPVKVCSVRNVRRQEKGRFSPPVRGPIMRNRRVWLRTLNRTN